MCTYSEWSPEYAKAQPLEEALDHKNLPAPPFTQTDLDQTPGTGKQL